MSTAGAVLIRELRSIGSSLEAVAEALGLKLSILKELPGGARYMLSEVFLVCINTWWGWVGVALHLACELGMALTLGELSDIASQMWERSSGIYTALA